MVSKLAKEHDRRSGLSHYLYGVSNLFISGTGIGGLSPIITGDEMGVNNILCLVLGAIAAFVFAYSANRVMKYNEIRNNMELYTIFMGLGALIGVSFAIWLNTKSGQKWIDEL